MIDKFIYGFFFIPRYLWGLVEIQEDWIEQIGIACFIIFVMVAIVAGIYLLLAWDNKRYKR